MFRGVVQELAAVAGVEATIRRILELAREKLGMELAWLSHFEDGRLVVEATSGALRGVDITPGFDMPLQDSYCVRVISGELPQVVADTAVNAVTAGLPVTAAAGIGAFVSVPLRTSDGLLYGSLCCFHTDAQPDLAQRDVDVMGMLAELISAAIDEKAQDHATRLDATLRVRSVIDGGGPRMVFQAAYSMPGRTVVGYEALARFPPDYPGPAEWFAHADQIGLGVELELAAARHALTALDVLPAPVWLSVNLSPAAICCPDLPALIPAHHHGRVVIEVTEHHDIADYDHLRTAMNRLRRLGVVFAADDAGSGYAGMRQLIELKPDIVKMDYHLTHDIDTDPARLAMATALHAFATATGAVLLAEGVETAGELCTVTHLGITLVQGYHLHRPADLNTIDTDSVDTHTITDSASRSAVGTVRQLIS